MDDPDNILSGGTITVDGILYIVPKNSLLTTPNQVVLWSELWLNGTVQMPLWPDVSWEASVFANEVNGALIAGMVFIEQVSRTIYQQDILFNTNSRQVLESLPDLSVKSTVIQGPSIYPAIKPNQAQDSQLGLMIPSADMVSRTFHLSPILTSVLTQPRYTDNPLWAADTENPSITSISAMPLCIQRPFVGNQTDDPLCPTKNRPLRDDGSAHTML